ncbi:hypothetical protein DAH66_06310 [Sphingomonas koreensis]|uniref:Uncharacterized protein n=2 Tax=Sphingomonas koreensis TaxID=93064 RepID=A0A430G6P5_9SPHN|nr:hypothetical protein DAH66_06310 [Sphingomonas koreensis]
MLLMIGYLTTPVSSAGVSLSEFWAWVRYLAAVTPDADLRLTKGFSNLDAHQKTILSDDFGMGVPMLWLNRKLGFDRICDGRYFVQRVAATVGATAVKVAKKGSFKTPDFVARDTSGVWHIIECKGTQSGHDYSTRQIGERRPFAWGGAAQKMSIKFPRNHTGQRLVCGLSIGPHSGSFGTRLTIVDPEPDDPFKVRPRDIRLAEDAAERGVLAKALRLSGFLATAEAMAAPWGASPFDLPRATRVAENRRQEFIADRDATARAELESVGALDTVFSEGLQFRGRELALTLPRPIEIGGKMIRKAYIRQGVNADVLEAMRERPTVEEPLADVAGGWRSALGRTMVEADELSAEMDFGTVFRSRIDLA